MSDCHGKYWIIPHRRLHQDLLQASATEMIDCTLDEHARYARAAMLNLTDEEMHAQLKPQDVFRPLSKEQFFAEAQRDVARCWAWGVNGYDARKALSFLSSPDEYGRVDPRVYVIREWGWIRVRENVYYAWKWDAITTERLFFCEDYWKKQSVGVDSWLDFVELSTNREFGMRHDQAVMQFVGLAARPGTHKCSLEITGLPTSAAGTCSPRNMRPLPQQ